MNSSRSKNNSSFLPAALSAIALMLSAWPGVIGSDAAAAGKGLDVEVPYEIKALKSSLVAPFYLHENNGGMIVSDQAGGVYSVTMSGKATELAGKSKIKNPAGVAVAPAGFGSHGGQVFVLASADEKSPCEVEMIDKSGAVSTFAKLPDAGAPATVCRALEFGPAGSLFAGKLFAATSGNSTIYAIDASGAATVFGSFAKPLPYDLSTIAFAPATDSKAPGLMLVGMRPHADLASKIGRIGIVGSDGKLKDDFYIVNLIRPGGLAFSPSNYGSYGNELFIGDSGKLISDSDVRDGGVYRVEKGISRPFAAGLMDPSDMKFVGKNLVICDPAEKGKGQGALVIVSSLL